MKIIKLTNKELAYLRYLMDTAAGTELDEAFDSPKEIKETNALIASIDKKLGEA